MILSRLLFSLMCLFFVLAGTKAMASDWVEDDNVNYLPGDRRIAAPPAVSRSDIEYRNRPNSGTYDSINQDRVTQLEVLVLGKTHQDLDLAARISQLEDCIFKSDQAGSLPERINNLELVMTNRTVAVEPLRGGRNKLPELDALESANFPEPKPVRRSRTIRSPAEIAEHLAKGVDAFSRNDLLSAKTTLKEVVECDPMNVDAHYNLGCIAEDEKDYQTALHHFKKAQAGRPRDSDIDASVKAMSAKMSTGTNYAHVDDAIPAQEDPRVVAQREMKDGNYGNAAKVLRSYLLDHPNDALGEFALGQVLKERRDFSGALAHLRRAIALDPGNKTYKRETRAAEDEKDLLSGRTNRSVGRSAPGGLIPIDAQRGPIASAVGPIAKILLGTALGMGLGALANSDYPGGWRSGMGAYGLMGAMMGMNYARY